MTTKTVVKDVTVDSLKAVIENMRFDRPGVADDDWAGFVSNIKAHGVLEPLIVDEAGNLMAGFRRLAAAKDAGLKTVPVIVRAAKDAAEAMLINGIENLQRKDVHYLETCFRFKKLTEAGIKQAEIARQLGLSEGTVSNYLRIAKSNAYDFLCERYKKGEYVPGLFEVQSVLGKKAENKDVKAAVEKLIKMHESYQKRLNDLDPDTVSDESESGSGKKARKFIKAELGLDERKFIRDLLKNDNIPKEKRAYLDGAFDALNWALQFKKAEPPSAPWRPEEDGVEADEDE